MSESLGVALTQVQVARIRCNRKRLFVESEKREIHKLLDRVATPQCPAAKAGAGLIQRRVQAGCVRWRVFEKAELRRRAQVSQDHPQEAKFRTGRALEPACQ